MSVAVPAPALARLASIPTLILAVAVALAQERDSRNDVEARLEALETEIGALQKTLEDARAEYSREQSALKSIDLDIQENARQLRNLQLRKEQKSAELDTLRAQKRAFVEQLRQREAHLSRQITGAYRLGRESRLKLILNQDSPARLHRMLAYYEYFSAAQAERISELRDALATLERLQDAIDGELQQLAGIEREHRSTEKRLDARRTDRLALLEGLQARIDTDQARLEELRRNRQDLETLLRRLGDALADIPADLGDHLHPGARRGQLPMPVDGRVLHAFGQTRGAGLAWQGWLIEADAGAEIRAIAYGRVAYADWLRGYGLLLIIDHGDGFMSLYGNNESLLTDVGDWVQPGAIIATLGSNPGQDQGLYFELRNEGKAVDPAVWIGRG